MTAPGSRPGRYLAGVGGLLAVTAVWGTTFPLVKDMTTRLPVADLLAVRYLLSGALLVALRPRTVAAATRRTWRTGAGLGVVYVGALVTQTYGLTLLPSPVSGFVTGSYVVATPLLGLAWFRTRVTGRTWLATGLAVAGLAAFTLMAGGDGGAVSSAGLALTVLSALLYAVHVVALSRWSRPAEAYALSVAQIATLALVLTAVAAPGGVTLPATPADWAGLVYLATVAGALSFVTQTWAQAHIPAAPAAIVMSVEPLWATAFAVLLYHETAGWSLLAGGACVLAATLLVSSPPEPGDAAPSRPLVPATAREDP
ncbi:DMT family transporter [Sphaerisporangium aureirubrum]|uniref:DMT family transporter n=1 Tax=Sphaerisporangium aureirubrum TaxID=1544736 RepID=A0ABW1NLZ9_9ACTN